MQGCRRGQDDEVHDQVGEEHSRDDVIARFSQLRRRGSFTCFDRQLPLAPLLFYLLRGLPEEQVGRNRGSEDSHQRSPITARPFDMGNKGRVDDRAPIGLGEESGQDIGEQDQGEPFKNSGDGIVRPPDQEGSNSHGVDRRPVHTLDAGDHLGHLRHATQVRSDVDGVGGDQQCRGAPQDPLGIMGANHAGQSLSRHHAQARAHHLHQQGRPQRRVPEGRACHRVSGDTRGIIVGGAGDQTRA